MVIVPGKDGKQVNIEATWERMPKEWAAIDELRIPIVLEKVYPSISEERPEGNGGTGVIQHLV